MELIDYVRIVRRRWALIALVIVVSVGGAVIATKLTIPKYQSSARLVVNGSSDVSAIDEIASRELANHRAVAFAQIAGTGPALQAALQQAQATKGPFRTAGFPAVTASANGTDPFIVISVKDTDALRAQAVANAYVTVLPHVLAQLSQPTGPNEIGVLDAAGRPPSPFSPRPKRNVLVGFAVGLVLGCGSALVRETLDRRLKDSNDVEEATGLTVLGVVPYEMPGEPLPADTHPMSIRAEAYRKVRTNLAFVTSTGTPKSVIITSATSSEGKTSLATNLAIACARSGQRVALVDADLRRPMVHTFLGLTDDKGLVDVLGGTAVLADALQYIEGGHIGVLVAGPVPSNPSELAGSVTMVEIIRQLESDFDIVLIDTPPVLPVADALHLSVSVDAVVVVTRLGETTRDRLRRTKVALTNVHANIVGVVPNGARQREDSAYAYAYRYRSRKKPLSIPYEPRDPQVEPHPDNLRPARRDSADHPVPLVVPDVGSSKNGAKRSEVIGDAHGNPGVLEGATNPPSEPAAAGGPIARRLFQSPHSARRPVSKSARTSESEGPQPEHL